MSAASADPPHGLAATPWQPKSLQAPRAPWIRLRWRLAILLLIVALHGLGGGLLLRMLDRGQSAGEDTALVVDFIDAPRPAPIVPPPLLAKPQPEPAPGPPARVRKKTSIRPARAPRTSSDLQAVAPLAKPTRAVAVKPSVAPGLQLYDRDGRLRVPADMLAQIDKQLGDQRVFSYQIPHIDDAKKYFYRNKVISYETTRFDQYWKPDQDMLTELLSKLAEKTTRQIKVPIPGHPGSTMVCSITLIALSGGCGILTNGADYVGPLDDPDTLNPEEDRQCQAWWEQIIGARTQDVWRQTRDLYEARCRKPLLRAQ